jgi:ribonuclease HI
MTVRAHRGLPVNEMADEWAAKGHTSVILLGEDRELELDRDLHLTQ